MTLNELLKNNPTAGDFPLYIDTENHYVKLTDAYQANVRGEGLPVLMLLPQTPLTLNDDAADS